MRKASHILIYLLLAFLLSFLLTCWASGQEDRSRHSSPNITRGTATMTVAPSNAPDQVKRQSAYICDGTGDDAQIQAALNALPTQGGKVWCAAGAYLLASPIKVPSNCTLEFEVGNSIKVAAAGGYAAQAAPTPAEPPVIAVDLPAVWLYQAGTAGH